MFVFLSDLSIFVIINFSKTILYEENSINLNRLII